MSKQTRFLTCALDAGCPRDQIENFLRAGYLPQPKQLQFHAACREADTPGGPDQIAFGGSRGPGKTHAMFAQITLDDCVRFPGLKAMMLRKTLKAAKESLEDLRKKVLPPGSHKYNKTTGEIHFPTGSTFMLGHYKDDRSFENLIGQEYDLIGIEEATLLEHAKYKDLRTCNRTSKPGWRERVYSNANPGGIGHAWYKARFIVPQRTGQETDTRFIPATCRDNRYINREEYAKKLGDLSGWKRRAWLDGDWNIMAGQFFSNYNLATHCKDLDEVSTWWPAWLAMDYGWVHPTFVLLFIQDPTTKDIYVIDEYSASRRLVQAHSNKIQEMLAHWAIPQRDLLGFYVSQDAFSKKGEEPSVADKYEELGWSLDKADMSPGSRIQGAGLVLQLLGDEDAGIKAKLFISERCVGLLECLPRMEHNPNRPEDVLKVDVDEEGIGGDDAYDCLRYGLLSRESAPGPITVGYI